MGAAADGDNWFSNYQKITSAKMETISGFKLSDVFYEVSNDNIASVNFPASTLSASPGKFNFVVANEAGWSSSFISTSSILSST